MLPCARNNYWILTLVGLGVQACIMRRDFVVQISIFSMPRCLGSESPSRLSTGFYVSSFGV